MKNRDYRLVVDGKYNVKAIMQRAWVYVRTCGYSFRSALKTSWFDASLKMDEYKSSLSNELTFPKKRLSLSDLYSNQFDDMANGNVCK